MAEREQKTGSEGQPAAGSEAPTSSQPAESGQPTAGDQLDALRQEVDEANRKGQEYLGLLQRVQADFINYRRRVEQERGESLQAGKAALAMRILPVLDDFDRALQHRPSDAASGEWIQGVELIARKLSSALEAEGITRIAALGAEFNPWEHEALLQAPSSEEESGKVTAVFREGYKLGDKVLRAAQVQVGRGPA